MGRFHQRSRVEVHAGKVIEAGPFLVGHRAAHEGRALVRTHGSQQGTARLVIEQFLLESRLDPVDFYAKDGHWTASGHAKIAQALAPIIERRRDRATQVPVR